MHMSIESGSGIKEGKVLKGEGIESLRELVTHVLRQELEQSRKILV